MLSDLIHTYPVLLWTLVYTLVAALVISLLWDKLKWWWLNTWYSFPAIGKLNSLSKDLHQLQDGSGWFKSERTLCQDYKTFVQVQSEYDFEQRMTYLHKAGDNGRSLTPLAIWVLVIGFVFIEAQGFSYVLAGYTVPGASETTQKYAAVGIAFIVSALCVLLTHFAGHELYISMKIKRARKDWIEDGGKSKLRSRSMPLTTAQHIDDDLPEYTQVSNRVGTEASFVVAWATLAFVLMIAIGATYVRVQSANKLMGDIVTTQKAELKERSTSAAGLDLAKPTTIPEADGKISQDADGKAVDEAAAYDLHGYWVTFAILAVLFVFLQALGVFFGYRWGFAGENSKAAFKALGKGRFLTYGDVRNASQQYIDKAQNQLENLHQRMVQRHAEQGNGVAIHPNKSFLEFLDSTEQQDAAYRNKKREAHHAQQKQADEDHERSQKKRAPSAEPVAPRVAASAAPAAHDEQVEAALRQLEQLGDDAPAKLAYLDTLPEAVFDAVKAVLQQRKLAKESAKKQRAAEIEDLL
jgi:hypothetical protein